MINQGNPQNHVSFIIWTGKGFDIRIVFINSKSFHSDLFFFMVSTFVDLRTGEHTNGIENCWSLMKKNVR